MAMRRNADGSWEAWIPGELAGDLIAAGLARRSEHELPPQAGGIDLETPLLVFGAVANYLTFHESTTVRQVLARIVAWREGKEERPPEDAYSVQFNGPRGRVTAELRRRPDKEALIAMARISFDEADDW